MPACILYCTVSISLMEFPYMLCSRSNSVLDRPCSAAESVCDHRLCVIIGFAPHSCALNLNLHK